MLTQLVTIRARLGLTDLEIQWDALLTSTIEAVSSRFDRECNRTFARTVDFAQEFQGGDREIILRCPPFESLTRFELKSSEASGWQLQLDVECIARHRCVLSLARSLGTDAQQGRVIYTGGYVLPGTTVEPGQKALPPEIEQAAVEQVCFWFQNRDRVGLSRIWEYHGTYRQYQDLDLLPGVRAILARHAVW